MCDALSRARIEFTMKSLRAVRTTQFSTSNGKNKTYLSESFASESQFYFIFFLQNSPSQNYTKSGEMKIVVISITVISNWISSKNHFFFSFIHRINVWHLWYRRCFLLQYFQLAFVTFVRYLRLWHRWIFHFLFSRQFIAKFTWSQQNVSDTNNKRTNGKHTKTHSSTQTLVHLSANQRANGKTSSVVHASNESLNSGRRSRRCHCRSIGHDACVAECVRTSLHDQLNGNEPPWIRYPWNQRQTNWVHEETEAQTMHVTDSLEYFSRDQEKYNFTAETFGRHDTTFNQFDRWHVIGSLGHFFQMPKHVVNDKRIDDASECGENKKNCNWFLCQQIPYFARNFLAFVWEFR